MLFILSEIKYFEFMFTNWIDFVHTKTCLQKINKLYQRAIKLFNKINPNIDCIFALWSGNKNHKILN